MIVYTHDVDTQLTHTHTHTLHTHTHTHTSPLHTHTHPLYTHTHTHTHYTHYTHIQVTYADLAVYHLFAHVVNRDDTTLSRFPALARLHRSIESLPNIAKFLHERPHDMI